MSIVALPQIAVIPLRLKYVQFHKRLAWLFSGDTCQRNNNIKNNNNNLASNFIFQPIAVENLGAFSLSTLEFLSDLSHKAQQFLW